MRWKVLDIVWYAGTNSKVCPEAHKTTEEGFGLWSLCLWWLSYRKVHFHIDLYSAGCPWSRPTFMILVHCLGTGPYSAKARRHKAFGGGRTKVLWPKIINFQHPRLSKIKTITPKDPVHDLLMDLGPWRALCNQPSMGKWTTFGSSQCASFRNDR